MHNIREYHDSLMETVNFIFILTTELDCDSIIIRVCMFQLKLAHKFVAGCTLRGKQEVKSKKKVHMRINSLEIYHRLMQAWAKQVRTSDFFIFGGHSKI